MVPCFRRNVQSIFRAEVRRLLEVLLLHPEDLTVDQTFVKTPKLKHR
jgi:hypothetical protein